MISLGKVERGLPELRRYRLMLIDESHNLRNRDGKRYRAIRKYIQENNSKCMLLSATPYNKSFLDLPWAIIRLIQRAGRVDKIGQKASEIQCYTFLPADGVERIINLRSRIRQRLKENSEVVGTDEAFFEDDNCDQSITDLYNEKAGLLDGDGDTEVDLASYAYQIWKNAISQQEELQRIIPAMPDVVFFKQAASANRGKA